MVTPHSMGGMLRLVTPITKIGHVSMPQIHQSLCVACAVATLLNADGKSGVRK